MSPSRFKYWFKGGALALGLALGCAPGWKGPKEYTGPLPESARDVAGFAGLPTHELWMHRSVAFFAGPPMEVGHFLAYADRKGKLQFLDPNTGRPKAEIKAKGGISKGLCLDSLRVFVVTENTGKPLQAFRLNGGKRIWFRKFSYPPEAPITTRGELWLPVADTLYALDPKTGDTRRTLVQGGDMWTTPVRWKAGYLLLGRGGTLQALDSLGVRLWSLHLSAPCQERPVVSGDTIWVSTTTGTLQVVDEGKQVWEQNLDSTALFQVTVQPGHIFASAVSGRIWALDPAGGTVQWQRYLAAPLSGAPLLHEGWLAASRLDGKVELLDTETGVTLDSLTYPSILPFPPVWAFGRLVIQDSDRRVHALGTSP